MVLDHKHSRASQDIKFTFFWVMLLSAFTTALLQLAPTDNSCNHYLLFDYVSSFLPWTLLTDVSCFHFLLPHPKFMTFLHIPVQIIFLLEAFLEPKSKHRWYLLLRISTFTNYISWFYIIHILCLACVELPTLLFRVLSYLSRKVVCSVGF